MLYHHVPLLAMLAEKNTLYDYQNVLAFSLLLLVLKEMSSQKTRNQNTLFKQ